MVSPGSSLSLSEGRASSLLSAFLCADDEPVGPALLADWLESLDEGSSLELPAGAVKDVAGL